MVCGLQGYGFGGTGKKSNMKRFDAYGEAYGNGDIIGCLLDFDDRKVSFRCPLFSGFVVI
jgi:ATP-dependent RNA helicase DDX1